MAECVPSDRPTQNSYRKPRRDVEAFGSSFRARVVPGGGRDRCGRSPRAQRHLAGPSAQTRPHMSSPCLPIPASLPCPPQTATETAPAVTTTMQAFGELLPCCLGADGEEPQRPRARPHRSLAPHSNKTQARRRGRKMPCTGESVQSSRDRKEVVPRRPGTEVPRRQELWCLPFSDSPAATRARPHASGGRA